MSKSKQFVEWTTLQMFVVHSADASCCSWVPPTWWYPTASLSFSSLERMQLSESNDGSDYLYSAIKFDRSNEYQDHFQFWESENRLVLIQSVQNREPLRTRDRPFCYIIIWPEKSILTSHFQHFSNKSVGNYSSIILDYFCSVLMSPDFRLSLLLLFCFSQGCTSILLHS